jgi:hypothetical protein
LGSWTTHTSSGAATDVYMDEGFLRLASHDISISSTLMQTFPLGGIVLFCSELPLDYKMIGGEGMSHAPVEFRSVRSFSIEDISHNFLEVLQ